MNDLRKILIIGSGGHAHSCIDIIESVGEFIIGGLVSDGTDNSINSLGYELLGTDIDLPKLRRISQYALIGIGQLKPDKTRSLIYGSLLKMGFSLPSHISPRAYVSPRAKIGMGTIIMNGAIVNAGAVIGDNCIINSRALVEHDAYVGDHCHISTGAIINGSAQINDGCFIGSGSLIKQGVTVSEFSMVKMGSVITSDVNNFGLAL